MDAADHHMVDDAAQRVEDEFGEIDVWVNNAFSTVFAPFTSVSAEEYQRVTEVTYLGYVNGTRAALRHMIPRDRARLSTSGPPWPTVGSRFSRPTAAPSMRFKASTSHCAASCSMTGPGCGRRWCSYRRSRARQDP